MNKVHLLFLLLLISTTSFAQNKRITGTVTDRDTKDAVMQVTVQLLKTDSTFVAGAVSDENGAFRLTAPADGKYIVKLTSVGYTPLTRDVTVSGGKDIALGNLVIGADAIMLKGTQVTAQASKVTLKKDTFIYNAAAYRTPEGSVVEELVKKLPGAQIDDDGKITINGKEVKKILLDGKEFMTGDTKTAMKNLPTSIINNIKAYDQQSDLTRITGIDDGNEETVLDFGIKPGMNRGTFANVDLGVGTKHRYAERIMGAVFGKKWTLVGMVNANNTNDMGFPGGGGGGRFGGRSGLTANKMGGLNFNFEDTKLKWDASIRWNHSDGDTWQRSSTEDFNGPVTSFSNSISQNFSRSNSWNGNMRIEWTPDSLTTITFRPTWRMTTSDGNNNSFSRKFNDDPYLVTADPLNIPVAQLASDSILVNQQQNGSISYSENNNYSAMLQLNRRLSDKGRNITLRGDFSYGDTESKNLSTSEAILFQIKNAAGNDSTFYTNRYNLTPSKNWRYAIQTTYSEPLWTKTYLQFSYQFTYSYNKSDRNTFDFSNFPNNIFADVRQHYRGWDDYLTVVPGNWTKFLDKDLSRFSEYKNYIHEMNVSFLLVRDKYRLNAGVMFQPQKSKFVQDYQGLHTDTVRNVFNVTPTLDLRYMPNDVTELRLNYRGTTSQPQMSDLLDITDDSNPLSITKGNPGLKPSFSNNLRLNYNTYFIDHQRSIMTFANYSNTRNSIASMVRYNELTGGTITRPENINGNWNAGLGLMFNTAIDSAGVWNVNTFTMVNYNNMVGYLYDYGLKASRKNKTRSTSIMERLQGSFRKDWFEIALDGSFNYMHTRNMLQSSSNLDTWQFSYGGSINIFAPWGSSISTDLHNQSRRGYSDKSMNTNELIWNAQISQSFLRGKPLTVSLQFYDILHEQSNYSRTISAMSRNDVEYNSINSYVMLHVIYRMNMFGTKASRQQMRGMMGRGFGGPGMPPGGGRPGGGRPGGFGGGGFGGGFGGGRPPRMN
ncbi:MAG: outer membrane beta-barrel protein [Prevotella sp.]|nr:outer membrane beta-barrel protein [Prevotella sp.]